jgi:hypothetical protein
MALEHRLAFEELVEAGGEILGPAKRVGLN